MESLNGLPDALDQEPEENSVLLPWYKQYPLQLRALLEKPFTLSSYITVGVLMLAGIVLFGLFLSKGCAPGAGPG